MKTLAQKIAAAEAVLQRADPKLGKLIALQAPIMHEPRRDYFYSLVRSIVGQQVSVMAAAAIFDRLNQATGLEPTRVVALSDDQARQLGLSRQKVRYIKDLASKFEANPGVYEHLEKLSDDAVIAELTAVVGIGVWTAQMFLMFTLVRLDVFAPDDIGLQRAMKALYGWDTLPMRVELERAAARWRPYRTVACWHLWKSLRNEPESAERWV